MSLESLLRLHKFECSNRLKRLEELLQNEKQNFSQNESQSLQCFCQVLGRMFKMTLIGDRKVYLRFCHVLGGRFKMGADALAAYARPAHWVTVTGFWLGETPVTNAQYRCFLEATKHPKPTRWDELPHYDDQRPVVNVNWYDASAFCRWLSAVSGHKCYLPSEAQWEFAARGTHGRKYPWGDDPPNVSLAAFGHGSPILRLAGSNPGNAGPYGTLDQAGNVWEWCHDSWDSEIYSKRAHIDRDSVDPVVDPARHKSSQRSARGGSYCSPAKALNCAYRQCFPAYTCVSTIGFRVAAAYNAPYYNL